MGKEKNAHQDEKLTTSGKYQKCLPYFEKSFSSLDSKSF